MPTPLQMTVGGQTITLTPKADVTSQQTDAAIKYGYKPVASPAATVSNTNSNTGGSLVSRYDAQKSGLNDNPAYNQPAPDEAAIRANYRQQAQSTVDAIRSTFDKYVQEDTAAKKKLESRAYLGALASGLSGSPTGAANEYKAAETGQKKVRETEAIRDSKINEAYTAANLRATEEFNKRRSEYLGAAKDKYAEEQRLNGNIQQEATNEINAYAAKRTYDEWVKEAGPARVQQYMNEIGTDEVGLKALFLKGAQDNLVNKDGTKLSDGSVAFYQKTYDANGNLTGVKEAARIQGSAGKTIKDSRLTDNGIQILYTDGSYEVRGTPGNKSGSGSAKALEGTPEGFTQDDIATGRQILNQYSQSGSIDPGIYVGTYKKWVESGGTLKKFIELYPPEEFIDPAQANLFPTFLQPKGTKTATATVVTTPTTSATTSSGRTY